MYKKSRLLACLFEMSFKEEGKMIWLVKSKILEPKGNGAYSHMLIKTDQNAVCKNKMIAFQRNCLLGNMLSTLEVNTLFKASW